MNRWVETRNFFLGVAAGLSFSLAEQDFHGSLESYILYLQDGHWWNTPWQLWFGVSVFATWKATR